MDHACSTLSAVRSQRSELHRGYLDQHYLHVQTPRRANSTQAGTSHIEPHFPRIGGVQLSPSPYDHWTRC